MAMTVTAGAAEIRVASIGATRHAAEAIAGDFGKQSGHRVNFTFENPAVLAQRLAKGETWDAVILAAPAMDNLEKAGGLRAGSRVKLARVGIGVVVKDGAAMPDISTVEGFKKAMLAARAVAHGDPALPNQSGAFAAEALKRAGIYEEMKSKTRVAGLDAAADLLKKGEIDFGFVNVSEVRPGLALVGPLPGPLQSYTNYDAAVMTAGAGNEAAAAFVKFLASAGKTWQAAKLEPATNP